MGKVSKAKGVLFVILERGRILVLVSPLEQNGKKRFCWKGISEGQHSKHFFAAVLRHDIVQLAFCVFRYL